MTNTIIDRDVAKRALEAAVELRGADYRDPTTGGGWGCTYWDYVKDQPSCLVATGLHALGLVAPDVLRAWDEANDGTPQSIGAVEEPEGVSFTALARDYLDAAQGAQDKGKPWGEAVRTANGRTVDDTEESYAEGLAERDFERAYDL